MCRRGYLITHDRDTKRHALTVPSVGEEDFANYSCEASNSLGKARAMIQLRGNPAPPQFNSQVRGTLLLTRLSWSVTCLGTICQYKLLPPPLGHPQLPEDSPVQGAVEKGGGK